MYHIEDNAKVRLSTDYESFNACYTAYVACYRCVPCYENRGVHIVNDKGEAITYDNHTAFVETI